MEDTGSLQDLAVYLKAKGRRALQPPDGQLIGSQLILQKALKAAAISARNCWDLENGGYVQEA